MIRAFQAVRRCRMSLVLGTSVLAWGTAPSAAMAQCAPDPTVADGTTTCSGSDTDGIVVNTADTTLTVEQGGTVTNAGAPAILVDVPRSNAVFYSNNTVNVLGNVSAPGQNAIVVTSGALAPSAYYSNQQVALTVGNGGSVTGATALALLPSPGNTAGTISATIDNAGTLTGTGGIALLGNATTTNSGYANPVASFASITNRAGGSIIGGILGPVSTLDNAGTIDGGAISAIDFAAGNNAYSATITNESGGTIRSNSAAATILTGSSSPPYVSITNSGTIANSGTGAVLAGSVLTVTNTTGGQIVAANGTAISTLGSLSLVNQGTVTGDVVVRYGGSTIDSSAGTINGSVLLGDSNNTLVTQYVGVPKLATGITGAVTVSGTNNTERVVFTTDTTVTTPISLDTGFQKLVLAPDANVTASLEAGFSAAGPLVISGKGAIVNQTALAGQGISDLDYAFGTSASFTNNGTITATGVTDQYGRGSGLVFSNHSFLNTGSITVDGGGGVSMSYNPIVNTGTITATRTGVDVFDAVLTNVGTIVSTAGTGVSLFGNVGYTASNSGTISGATNGVVSYGYYLTNTGTIRSAGTGVSIDQYLINGAGGVVTGGSGPAVVAGYRASVANAGTINGDVQLTGGSGAYLALTGGVLNGNLQMAEGSTLVTDLVNTGSGAFAGINGTVTASGSATLRYAVNADAATTLAPGAVGPFSSVGYQLGNGATLTLAAPATQTRTQMLVLAGDGTVDLNANFDVAGGTVIRSTSALTYPGATSVTGGLSIINRGTIAAIRNGTSYYSGAIELYQTDSFTNAGTITVSGAATYGYGAAAIYGGASVTNAGSITLDGGVGISGTVAVTNSGTIDQVAGGLAANGVSGFSTLTNTGTISVAGTAVLFSNTYTGTASTLLNSGKLISTTGAAIGGDQYSYNQAQITNQAGGAITGVDRAIQLYSATLSNAGAITGTVDLGYAIPYYSGASTRSYSSSIYVAAGGTIAGDLLFGNGADLLLQTGDSLGVSGIVDGGDGINVYGRGVSTTGTVTLDLPANVRNFQDRLVAAIGADTVATAASNSTVSGNLYVVGNGSVVNQATITGTLTAYAPSFTTAYYTPNPPFPADQILASLTNSGSVEGGVVGTVARFTNTGAVTAPDSGYIPAVSLYGDKTLSFTNSGMISLSPTFSRPTVRLSATNALSIANSGQISGGGLLAYLTPTEDSAVAMRFANSGTITSTGTTPGVDLEIAPYGSSGGGTIQIENSGAINAQTSLGFASGLYLNAGVATQPLTYTIVNSGTITASETSAAEDIYSDSVALFAAGDGGTITNAAGGTIKATGAIAIAVFAADHALKLTNAGTITASGSRSSTAIGTADAFDNTIVNTGTINGDIVLAAGADTLDNAGTINGRVSLGAGDDRLILRGGTITGPIDGGDGNDSIDIAGGTAAAPVAVGSIANVEMLRMSAGLATISETASLGSVALSGGRLVGLAGSTITAPTITVGTGAIFGSAGTVNGNIAVTGTLSPGASPAAMTVNGNVALGGSSTSLFEITPTVSDKLIVNGTLSIANGATLQLAQTGKVLPGTTLDLITVSGGITGRFTTVQRNGSAFELFSQDSTRLRLMATFFNDTTFNATAQRAVDYVNGVLLGWRATPSLLAAVPLLLTASGDTNAAAFTRIAPQAYAAAQQIGVDNGLTLADAARGPTFEPTRDTPGLFSFASVLGGTRTLDGDPIDGTARATTNGYGFLGGIGFAGVDWSLGAFGGYLNDRQTLAGLGARTSADGVVAGVHGRVRYRGIGLKVTFAYDGARADTRRALPGSTAQSRYDLHGWTVDGSIDTLVPLTGRWSVRPSVGATMIRTTRDGVTESGNSPFALAVAGRRGTAVFVDGGATFTGTASLGHAVTARPYLTLGARYQAQGRTPYALASLGGGAIGLLAEGAARAPVVATATLGIDVPLSPSLAVFGLVSGESGNGDHRASGRGGLRLAF